MRFASAAGSARYASSHIGGTRRSRSTAIGTKQLTPSVRGFRTMKTTYATTKGFESCSHCARVGHTGKENHWNER